MEGRQYLVCQFSYESAVLAADERRNHQDEYHEASGGTRDARREGMDDVRRGVEEDETLGRTSADRRVLGYVPQAHR